MENDKINNIVNAFSSLSLHPAPSHKLQEDANIMEIEEHCPKTSNSERKQDYPICCFNWILMNFKMPF